MPLPSLSPVDSATEDAVTASAEAMASCFAISDPLRGLVGFSEGYLTRIAVEEGVEGINSALSILTDAGYAESVSMAVTAVGTSRMGRLADGRIGVARTVVSLSPGGTPVPESRATVLFVFAEAANGWLLDDVVLIEPNPAGTPTA